MYRIAVLSGLIALVGAGCGDSHAPLTYEPICSEGELRACSCLDGKSGFNECVFEVWSECICDVDASMPIADAGADQAVASGEVVTLDGTGSYDPISTTIEYAWSLTTVPEGSAAVISDASAAMPTFVPDRAGTYVARLVVWNGARSSVPDTVTIVATNDAPVAVTSPNQNVYRGNVAMLDGTASHDPNGDPITYQWTLTSVPSGSAASLSDASAAKPTFVADEEGSYELTLVVSDGELESASVTVTVACFREIAALAYRVIDAEYSDALDAIVMVASSPNALYLFDPATGTSQSIALDLTPTAVSVGPSGTTAAVGHNGYISHVDLEALAVLDVLPVSTDVLDVVLAGNGYAYAFPREDQWESIRCIDLSTGTETTSGGYSIYAGTRAKLHPSGTKMYGADSGLSPSDIERYDISGGTAAYDYDSPYHGDYPMCGDLWMSADGARIFTACGNAFRTSDVQAEDMTYNGALEGVSRIEHLSHASAAGKIVVVPGVGWLDPEDADTYVRIHGDAYLGFEESLRLPSFIVEGDAFAGHGRFAFANTSGTEYYVVMQADPASALLADYGVVTYGF